MKKRLPRLYAPFIKQGRNWIRWTWKDGENKPAFGKQQAVRIYQNWLLESSEEIRQLRPLPVSDKEYLKHPMTLEDNN